MNSLTSASVCPPWRHTVTGAHSERKRTRGFAPSTPASVFLLLALKRSRAVQKEEREREKRLSRNSSVKQYRVPLKTSDKKAHMIPELQSPIPSAKAASAFLSVWMLQQHGGEKKIQDKAKKKTNWRNVTIQRSFSWRGGNWCERSYSGTPLSLETLDQNGRLQSRAAFLFIFFPLPLSLSLLDLLQIWAT